ncbi:MAG: CDP-alcohol phosphatidyltransferase family protein [Rhodospirillaceae bacterium]|nr:CDP-alcohol phosphatidyltransferase family protein [Rhodospirillaceae bacterium]
MLDPVMMRLVAPPLKAVARELAARGVRADHITVTGFALGCVGAGFIASGLFGWGLAFIALNRLCDGLDGAVARLTARTDFGGFLDIVLDFVFYGLVPLAFAVADRGNALVAAALSASFMASGGSFLAFAAIASKRGLSADSHGPKSFFYARGLAEGTETFAFFALVCLVPAWFAPAGVAFAALCWLTAIQRVAMAVRVLKD